MKRIENEIDIILFNKFSYKRDYSSLVNIYLPRKKVRSISIPILIIIQHVSLINRLAAVIRIFSSQKKKKS